MRKADEKTAKKEDERLVKGGKSMKPVGAVVAPTAETGAATTAEPSTTSASAPAIEVTPEPTSATEPETPISQVESASAVHNAPFVAPTIDDTTTELATPTHETPAAPAAIRTSMEDGASARMREISEAADTSETTPQSPTKKGVFSKLKSRFSSKSGSKSQKSLATDKNDHETKGNTPTTSRDTPAQFLSGAAATGASTKNDSTTSLEHSEPALAASAPSATAAPTESTDEPATPLAAVEHTHDTSAPTHSVKTDEIPVSEYLAEGEGRGRAAASHGASEASSLNSVAGDGEEFQEARDNFDEDLAPPPTFVAEKSSRSPVRDSKFKEVL